MIPGVTVQLFGEKSAAARAAATEAAAVIRGALQAQGRARIMVGTGNSQLQLIECLVAEPGLDWARVEAFHLDEYIGIDADHPASFRRWIRTRFAEKCRPGKTHYLEVDGPDLQAKLDEYSRQLAASPVDLAFVGIGENGHIAFNDPEVADFNDPLIVKRVRLDQACRAQQVGEGHFPGMEQVPRDAATVTCPGLFRAARWICMVPELRKATAVRNSLEGEISTRCPGSLIQRHLAASVYLDQDSASLLSESFVRSRCRVDHDSFPSAPRAAR